MVRSLLLRPSGWRPGQQGRRFLSSSGKVATTMLWLLERKPNAMNVKPIFKIWNVQDRRHGWIGEWEVSYLNLLYADLSWIDKGRSVIYQSFKNNEVGTITSFNEEFVWVRFGVRGSTSAACKRETLVFALRPLDGDLLRGVIEIL